MISDNIKIGNTPLQIYSTTGIVVDTNTRSETEISGGGGSSGSGGNSSPIHISSKTTRYQELFLIDIDGREYSFSLVNFLVSCRKGNLLTVVQGIKPGKNKGPYLAAYNHDAQEIYYDNDILDEYCRPLFVLPLILYPALVITGLILGAAILSVFSAAGGIAGAIIGGAAGWALSKFILNVITDKKIKQFTMSPDWQSIIEGFAHISKEKYKVSE